MAVVGEFPGFAAHRRKTLRAPVNPMDKSTIVSIYPKFIREVKQTIIPGTFEIAAGSYEKPAILVVGSSSWWREIDAEQPLLEIPNSSIQVADSIVKDYCNGLLACNMSDAMPGIFYVPGEIGFDKLRKDYKAELDRAAANQKRWYAELIKLADTGWAKSNGNPLTISDDMRLAARELGLNNKDWMQDFQSMEMVRCIACGALRNPLYPICGSCHTVIDTKRASELNLILVDKK